MRHLIPALCVATCLALGAGTLSSCMRYTTSATGKGGVASVAVPLVENESLEAGLQQSFTDSLIQAFVTNGAVRVEDEGRAQIVLRGTIVDVREEPFTYDTRADQYQISIFLDMRAYDTIEKQTLWEQKRMRGYGIFDAAGDRATARAEGVGAAIRMLVEDVVDRTQAGGW